MPWLPEFSAPASVQLNAQLSAHTAGTVAGVQAEIDAGNGATQALAT